MMHRCAVTGAGGYVGSRISAYMRRHGWDVLELTRHPSAGQQMGTAFYSLERNISPELLRNVRALIHCAYDFRPISLPEIWRVNVEGSANLFDSARRAGVDRIVCISTISAYDGCRSLYGKAKLAIEEAAVKVGGIVVRPGLVYGPKAGGMLGSLNRTMASAKVMPLIGNGSWMTYPAFEDDVCELIYRICEHAGEQTTEPITAASSRGIPFKTLLSDLARAHGNRPLFVQMPWRVVWGGLRLLETVGLKINFRSDSVLGLVYPNPNPSFKELQSFGMTFRDFSPELLK